MMIFTSTCEHTQKVAIMLRNLGFGAIPLHGKMSQPKRLGMYMLIVCDVNDALLYQPSIHVM